jgi:hypothetical protein
MQCTEKLTLRKKYTKRKKNNIKLFFFLLVVSLISFSISFFFFHPVPSNLITIVRIYKGETDTDQKLRIVRSVLYVYILQNQENNTVPNSLNEVPYSVKIKCPESPPHNPYVSVRNIQGVIIISELLNCLMTCNNRVSIVRTAEIKIPVAYIKLNENYVKVIYLDNIEYRKNFFRVRNYSINRPFL